MTTELWVAGGIAGAVIIAGLAAYAIYLHWKLYRLRQKTVQSAVEVPKVYQPGNNYRVDVEKSLYLLADAMLDNKMTHTEGCIRVCAVASTLENASQFRQEYGVLFHVAEATAHIPILDDWKALSKEDKKRFDESREKIESKYEDAIREAATRLHQAYSPTR